MSTTAGYAGLRRRTKEHETAGGQTGHTNVIEELVDWGADVEQGQHDDIVALLKQSGAK